LAAVDVIHVAGLATPPTGSIPLIISVDDLRPLRTEARTHLRITQLKRAVERGAILVASSRSASHEVIAVLGVQRNRVVVVPPAVPLVEATKGGEDLVVNITGADDLFLAMAPELIRYCNDHDSRVVALASSEVGQRIHSSDHAVVVRPRGEARDALSNARVVMHLSDGARFPSFAIAAMSAGVPTIARATEINRELLEGAAALATNDQDRVEQSCPRRDVLERSTSHRTTPHAPTSRSITRSCEAGRRDEDNRDLRGTALAASARGHRDLRSRLGLRSRSTQ
jgi:hypothetical protein